MWMQVAHSSWVGVGAGVGAGRPPSAHELYVPSNCEGRCGRDGQLSFGGMIGCSGRERQTVDRDQASTQSWPQPGPAARAPEAGLQAQNHR